MKPASLPDYDAALALVLEHAPPLGDETVAWQSACGRTLRAAVTADRDQPPFDRSAMDGFAVRSADVTRGAVFAVTGSVAAGQAPPKPGESDAGVMRIATGAVLPASYDAVIPIEQCNVSEDHGLEQVSFILDAVKPYQNVHRRGVDAKAGDVVLGAGLRFGAQHVGIAAAVGAVTLTVAEPPRITVLTTGDEVMPPDTPPDAIEPHQIRNSNGPMLTSLLDAWGAQVLEHVHVADDPEPTLAASRDALSHSHIVVTVGGVSAGQRDFLPGTWRRLGLADVLHGVAIQPGKPLFVARDECKLAMGLPGNPVSVWATAHLFLRPVIATMLAAAPTSLPWRTVALGAPARAKSSRQLFRAARLDRDGRAGIVSWQGSGDLMHTAGGDGFVRLPREDRELAAGESVEYLPW